MTIKRALGKWCHFVWKGPAGLCYVMLNILSGVKLYNTEFIMTLKLKKGDRFYKIIEARTFSAERKRVISKIDKNGKITVLTYIFSDEDLREDGTVAIENKRMSILVNDIDKEQFKFFMDMNYKIYPQFRILWEKDYSNKSLEEAIELMNIDNILATDIPIRDLIREISKDD